MLEGKHAATLAAVLALIFSSVEFFILPKIAQAAPDHVVINEMQITGGTGHTTDDFIELFNPTASPFDLKGYRLIKRTATGTADTAIKSWTNSTIVPAYGFYIWANAGYTTIATTPDATTSESIADNNGIALRQGAENTGTIIDSVAWGTANNGLAESSAYIENPTANQSLERKKLETGSRQDTNDNNQDFVLQTSPTPQNSSSPIEKPNNPNDNSNPGGGMIYVPPVPLGPQPGEVVINEFVSDPADGQQEWIELYNRTTRVIDLSGWTIEDGSKSVTNLNGTLGTDSSSKFLIIYSPKGNLNNDGDQITLKYNDTIIDQIAYGKWDDGNISNNAPLASDPLSISRFPDGVDTNNDQTDFVISEPTPGQLNKKSAQTTTATASNEKTTSQTITFSEVYPNPPLGDETDEFIELINQGNQIVDLRDFTISDKITSYTINSTDWLSTTIEPNKTFLFPRPKTKIALDNDGTEHLTLKSPDGSTIDKLTYTGPVAESISYAKNEKGEWSWTTTLTPGAANIITLTNKPPHIALDIPDQIIVKQLTVFDASDTIDPEGKKINFLWNFGDGYTSEVATPSHLYTRTGKFTIKLLARDADGQETIESKNINVKELESLGRVEGASSTAKLILNELMPNPKGSDNAEWIELFNPENTTSNTKGWKLIINEHSTALPDYDIPAEGYLTISKVEGKFSLVNDGATIILESPSGERSPKIEYSKAPEGLSFALENGNWQWTTTPTPSAENIILTDMKNQTEDYQQVIGMEVKTLENGTRVQIEGVVAAEPGTISNKIIFLASPGLQISLNGGDAWPKLQLGDKIIVKGTISKNTSGIKLVIKNVEDIVKLNNGEVPQATPVNLADITEDNEGDLIIVNGKVTQSSNTAFTIGDNSDSLRIALRNREVIWPKISTGIEATTTGFVTLNRGKINLWARSPNDITTKQLPATTQNIDLAPENKTNNLSGYLFLGLIIIILSTAYFWEKLKLPKLPDLIKKYLSK